jgi:spectinomycin phosphotransferase
VPRFLKDQGVDEVVAPFYTNAQKLFAELDGFALILYPFIHGQEAMKVGLFDSQWTEFGSILKRIHRSELPSQIEQVVKRETFLPKWSRLARELHEQVNTQNYDDPVQRDMAAFWNEKNETIQTLILQAERIGETLRETHLEFVLCHADIHTANLLLTREQEMFIVDWDDTLFAPRERDLMFVPGGNNVRTREEQKFFEGYGPVDINPLALAYYRYEWCVQEIGDFGQRVFMANHAGNSIRQSALEGFKKLFSHSDVVEVALHTPFELEPRRNLR